MQESLDPALEMALARYEAIAPLVCRPLGKAEKKWTLAQLAQAVHPYPGGPRSFHPRTLERWASWYQNAPGEGRLDKLQALLPKTRSDKGAPRALDEAVIEEAIRLRKEDPARSTSTLLTLLDNPPVKEATLAYHLRARGATRRELGIEERAFSRYEHQHRNSLWQGDFSAGLWLPDPRDPQKMRRSHLHVFLDDFSRYCVHGEFYFHENLPCLEDAFRKAVLKGGVPSLVYWDQGAVYKAKQIRLLAARLGTRIVFATPYAPEGKGKVERFFGVLKSRFYPEAGRSGLTTLEELNHFFWAWLEECYHQRVHGETKQTPKERWEADAGKVRFPDPEKLPDLFLWEEERTVDKTGTVSLCSNHYPVPEEMVGKVVRVLFDPFDLARVRIYYQGRFLGVFSPYQLVSHTFRKAISRKKEPPAPRASSVELRGRLVRTWRQEVDSAVTSLDSDGEYLTCPQFLQILSDALGRKLQGQEPALARSFYSDLAPLSRRKVSRGLAWAIGEKGVDRHLRFYLDAIRREFMQDDNREVL